MTAVKPENGYNVSLGYDSALQSISGMRMMPEDRDLPTWLQARRPSVERGMTVPASNSQHTYMPRGRRPKIVRRTRQSGSTIRTTELR